MSPDNIQVSIIIPCFNAEKTIAETVDSALSQELDKEVIVVDDGSTDGSANILSSYGSAIITSYGPNRGVSSARNIGLSLAKGEWIQFLDSDDLLLPGALRQQCQAAIAAQADCSIGGWTEFIDDDGHRLSKNERFVDIERINQDAMAAFAITTWAPPVAVLYHRRIMEIAGGFRADLPIIQDARLLFDVARADGRFTYVDNPVGLYRLSAQSLSRRNRHLFWQDCLLNLRQIELLWRADKALNELRQKALFATYLGITRALLLAGSNDFEQALTYSQQFGIPPLRLLMAGHLAKILGAKRIAQLLARLYPAKEIY